MSTAVVPFEQAPMPAHIAEAFGDEQNIEPRLSLPTLSFRGKVWRIVINGEESILTRRDPESGEQVPRQMIELVVLGVQARRSRAYFEGDYEEGKHAVPSCFSQDGVLPDPNVRSKQGETCASCPQAVKGAKITPAGKAVAACSMFKRLAVVPAQKIDFSALLLKLPITSLWDRESEEQGKQGWYAWDQYVEFLLNRGVKHTAAVVTAVKFDTTAHPKLFFKVARWLEAEHVAAVQEAKAKPLVEQITGGSIPEAYVAAGAPAEGEDDAEGAPAALPAPTPQRAPATAPKAPAPAKAAAPAQPPTRAPAAPKPPAQAKAPASPPATPTRAPAAPVAAAVPAKATAPKPAAAKTIDLDGNGDSVPVGVGSAPMPQAAGNSGAADDDLNELLKGWDD